MDRSVAVLVGSLRRESFSRRVALALAALAPPRLRLSIIEIGGLPHYNQDFEDEGRPLAPWLAFREEIRRADAVLFVTPEYNRSIPGVLKNAIDVASRPYGQSAWEGKPAAIVSVTPGAMGGFGANHALRQCLAFLDMPVLQQPEAYIGDAAARFPSGGGVQPAETRDFLAGFMARFAAWIDTLLGGGARPAPESMKAVRVRAFGGREAMTYEDVPIPVPGPDQVLVRVAAAGVGPWDAWVRAGRSVLPQPLPLTLGSDLSGTVVAVGAEVTAFAPGTEVFGATNPRFTGAYAAYALAEAGMIARKPATLGHVEAASVPVIGCTADQMLFAHAGVQAGQTVVVLGGGGNVGAFAVQLAALAGARVVATGRAHDLDRIRGLGAAVAVAGGEPPPAALAAQADAVIDTVGGAALAQAFAWLRPGGALISAVAEPDQAAAGRHGVRARFILVAVTTAALDRLAGLFRENRLRAHVGHVLRLSEASRAHAMMEEGTAGPGKIVLVPEGCATTT